jgi:hypothetical protein
MGETRKRFNMSTPLLAIHSHVPPSALPATKIPLDDALRSAAILNWKALTQATGASLLHIEYSATKDGKLDFLKLWTSSERGYWRLGCEYWMGAGIDHGMGSTFRNNPPLPGLASMLDIVMQNQKQFTPASSDFPNGLLQLEAPTLEDVATAERHRSALSQAA